MRKFTISALALAAALTGGAAIAQSVSPGAVQLANIAGVEPGLYTNAQLIRLIDAQRNDDTNTIRFILSQGTSDVTRSDMGGVTPGAAQIAASLGVQPGTLSLNELIRLDAALAENDEHTADYIRAGQPGPSSASAADNAGAAQLAAILGVNPADYTLAELVQMRAEQMDD